MKVGVQTIKQGKLFETCKGDTLSLTLTDWITMNFYWKVGHRNL